MRRYTFYLSVALSAFGIGLFVVFKFYWLNEINLQTAPKIESTAQLETLNQKEIVDEKLTCKDKSLQPFWKILKKHENFKNLDKFYKWLDRNDGKGSHDCGDFFKVIAEEGLSKSGENVIFVKGNSLGFGDMAGNSEFYVFQNGKNGYKKILFDEATFNFEIPGTTTNGYYDINLLTNDRLGSGNISVYKFDGKNYKKKECFERIWRIFKDGDIKQLDKPIVKRQTCN